MSGSRVVITADSDQAVREFNRLKAEATGSLGKIAEAGGKLNGLMGSLGLTISGAAFASWIKGAIDAADDLNDLSATTKIAVSDLAGLQYAAKLTGSDLEATAKSINKLSVEMGRDAERFAKLGVTAKEPLEAYKQFADVFAAIEDPQLRAALGAQALGKSWEQAAPMLDEGSAGIAALIEKGKQLNPVTDEMAAQAAIFNDQVDEMSAALDGLKTKLAADMLPGFANVTRAVKEAYEEGGKLSALWTGLGALGSFMFTDEFASSTVKLKALRKELQEVEQDLSLSKNTPYVGWLGRKLFGESTEVLEEKVRSIRAQIKEISEAPAAAIAAAQADAAAKRAAGEKAAADKAAADEARRKAEAFLRLQESEQKSRDSFVAGLQKEAALLGKSAEEGKLYEAQLKGITGSQLETVKALLAKISAHKAEEKAIADSTKFQKDYAAATAYAYETYHGAAARAIEDATTEADRNVQLAATYGMTASAIQQTEIARLEEQLAQRASTGLTLDEIENLEKLIDVKKRNAAALATIDAKDAAKSATAEWKQAAGQIENSLTDALLRGFESGKGFGRNLVDTIKNMFGTLVLRPIISAVVNPVAGAITGAIGLSSTAQAASSATGSALGTGLGIGGVLGSITTGALQTAGAVLTGQIGLGTTLSAGMSAIGTGTLSGISAGLSSVVGALGPIALALGAAVMIWKKLDTSGTKHTGAASYADASGVRVAPESMFNMADIADSAQTKALTDGIAQGVVKILDSTATAFGKTAGYSAATAFADDTSKDGAWGALLIKNMGQTVLDWNNGRTSQWAPKEFADGKAGQDQYLAALSASVRTALNGIGLPSWAKEMLDKLGAGASIEELAKVVDTINATQGALKRLATAIAGIAALDDAATSALMKASGGIEALTANASAYYDNFYLETEKSAAALSQMTSELAAVGVAMPATRAAYRAQVEAQLALGAQGTAAAAVLLKNAGAFAQLHPEVVETAEAVEQIGRSLEDIASERKSLQDQLDQLTMSGAQLREKERNAIDESNRAIFDRINAINGERAAVEAAKSVAAGLLSDVDAAYSNLQAVVGRQRDAVTDAHNSAMKLLDKQIAAQTEVLNKHKALSGLLTGSLDSMKLRGSESTDRALAQAQIRTALALAKAGGVLPDAEALRKSLGVVGQDASAMFASYEEYARDFYQTQNDIAALGKLTDDALSVEEATLEALTGQKELAQEMYEAEMKRLDTMLSNAAEQVAVLKGQSTTLLSIDQALQAFLGTISAALNNPIAAATGQITGTYQSALGRAPDAAGMKFWQDRLAEGVSASDISKAIANSPEAKAQRLYQQVLGRAGDAEGVKFWTEKLASGVSEAAVRAAMYGDVESRLKRGLPPLAAGTNFLPSDMPILAHEGERIMPAADNRELMRRLSSPPDNGAALAREVRALREENARMREMMEAHLYAIAKNTLNTADHLDGAANGEKPLKTEAA